MHLSHHAVPPPGPLTASSACPAASAGDVFLSWHSPSMRVLAVGAGGRVLLMAVPLEGMEQLEFDLNDESTPGGHCELAVQEDRHGVLACMYQLALP